MRSKTDVIALIAEDRMPWVISLTVAVLTAGATVTAAVILKDRKDYSVRDLDDTPVIFCRVGPDHTVLEASGRGLDISTMNPSDLIGKTYDFIFRFNPEVVAALNKALTGVPLSVSYIYAPTQTRWKAYLVPHKDLDEVKDVWAACFNLGPAK